jgi:hypothetical protein
MSFRAFSQLSDIEAVQLDIRFRVPLGRLPKMLNFTEGAHIETMSIFETHEHLRRSILTTHIWPR